MTCDYDQPTLFELTACDELEPPRGLPLEGAATREGDIAPREPEVFRAVSPLANMPLGEVCAACGREITGRGFVILDYEELGAFCDQECGDKRFRSYLHEAPEERVAIARPAL